MKKMGGADRLFPARAMHRTTDVPGAPPRWFEGVLIAGAWLLVMAVALIYRALDPAHPFTLHTIGITSAEYLPWALLTPLIFRIVRRFPLEAGNLGRRLAIHLLFALLVAAGVQVVQRVAISALGPPPRIAASSSETGPGDDRFDPYRPTPDDLRRDGGPPDARLPDARLPDARLPDGVPPAGPGGGRAIRPQLTRLPLHLLIYLLILCAGFARSYALQWRARQAEAASLAAQLTEAKLRALRSQLNPHFLFNALNAVSALADDDPNAVRRLVSRLSSLLRRVLDEESARDLPVREEMSFLRDYLAIQHMRFHDRLDVVESIDPDAANALVPGLILQPIVENAVEHAAARRTSGRTTIAIEAQRIDRPEGRRLRIVVRDNGSGREEVMQAGETREGAIGLRNTRERLAAHYGDDAQFSLHPLPEGGTEAVLDLPFTTNAPAEEGGMG